MHTIRVITDPVANFFVNVEYATVNKSKKKMNSTPALEVHTTKSLQFWSIYSVKATSFLNDYSEHATYIYSDLAEISPALIIFYIVNKIKKICIT